MIDFTLVSGDPDEDFFVQNPEMQFYPFVQKIKNSLFNNRSSDILWSLYMVEDPKSKIYYGMDMEARIEAVEKKYHVNYIDDCVPYRDAYINAAMGPHEKNYKRLNDKFQKMIAAAESLEINEATDFFAKLKNMYIGLDSIEEKYVIELEKAKERYKGKIKPGGLFRQNAKR